ncbi:MAG TPA: aminotransferase class III-fold pyridoxal phosphate-dependent enzyme, partial [Candidatus Angelobacter sp.]|nr:aminotransferase class III-fold pyridoxal phosphate-dependent enzyme [Candidatus Angelobacter sp.]
MDPQIIEPHAIELTQSELLQVLAQHLGCKPEEIPLDKTFLEMGVDSLGLLSSAQVIREKMGVRIPFRMLLDEYPTIPAVAAYITEQRPPLLPASTLEISESAEQGIVAYDADVPEPTEEQIIAEAAENDVEISAMNDFEENGFQSGIEEILAKQLELMQMQLRLLSSGNGKQKPETTSNGKAVSKLPASLLQDAAVGTGDIVAKANAPELATQEKSVPATREQTYVAYEKLNIPTGGLDQRQSAHLQALISTFTARTAKSKTLTQKYRKVLSDNRVSAGFRMLWKEMVYQILMERAQGSRVWDVDGNEYIDISMGYGSILFGHSPLFLMERLAKQVELGVGIGPQSYLAGPVADLLCRLTGCERAAFCNSGTEAVMSALRLARTYTGRSRFAMFTGSYHGTFDGVMVRGESGSDGLRAVPLAPGVPRSMISDVLLLRYGQEQSLETLKRHASELAAVLVAPVPSRDPEGHNQAFLHALRDITRDSGAALIFDEVVTGFRVHPGGAQALFQVHADLVTYGKAVGGGFPIGIVAGDHRYMDAIDGGDWTYGDKSYPREETTFFAG